MMVDDMIVLCAPWTNSSESGIYSERVPPEVCYRRQSSCTCKVHAFVWASSTRHLALGLPLDLALNLALHLALELELEHRPRCTSADARNIKRLHLRKLRDTPRHTSPRRVVVCL